MSQLRWDLEETNGRCADNAKRQAKELSCEAGRKLLSHVWAGFQPDRTTPRRLRASARAFVSILDMHPAENGEPLSRAGIPIFSGQEGFNPLACRDAGQVLFLGSLYFGFLKITEGSRIDRLWDIMLGANVIDTMFRDALVGKPFGPEPRIPPNLFDYIRDFAERNCIVGVRGAMRELSGALTDWNSRSHANGITQIDPPQGCTKKVITVRGNGFGAVQPKNVEVYFPTRSGGCTAAEVLPNGWQDTAIQVYAPPNVGTGCVGFVVHGAGGADTLAQSINTFVGEVTNCLGPLTAEPIRANFDRLALSALKVPCPPCRPNDVNRFTGGPPVIQTFLGERIRKKRAYGSTVLDLEPGDMLELRWNVNGATQVQIIGTAINSHLNELPRLQGPFPSKGTRLVQWQGTPFAVATFSWDAAYELRATNACGSVMASLTVRMRLPPKDPPGASDFLWGVATAGRQVEGNLTGDDWHIFTTDPQILQRLQTLKRNQNLAINPQDAAGAINHWAWGEFVRSVERARALGLNAYRFSIEWSRIEPAAGTFNSGAIANYQMMVAAVRAHGMEPIVVLNHLSLPAWVQKPPRRSILVCCDQGGDPNDPDYLNSLRGWETNATVDAYVRYVEFVVTSLRNSVRWWITFNEPLATTVPTGYLASVFPPGFLGDGKRGKTAIHNIITAHAKAYERIHAIDPEAQVGITDQWLFCKDVRDPNATRFFVYYHQDFLINALVHGNEDLDISVLSPRNERVLEIAASDWKPHLDFFGLQYYKSVYPYHFIPLAIAAPWMGARVDLDLTTVSYSHLLLNDMGWEMSPEGLYESLLKLKRIARFNNRDLPILVAENGTAEVVDHNRSVYVTSHLEQLQRAQRDGVPVIGYLHWSIADNWEWIDGYRSQARFGLFSVDRSTPALTHSITDGALALAYAMENPQVTIDEAIKRFGRYTPNGASVEHPTMSPYSTWQGFIERRPITLLIGSVGHAAPAGVRIALLGLLFYGDTRTWLRLDEVTWDAATRKLQFFQRSRSIGGAVPELLFAGDLDATANTLSGVASEPTGNSLLTHNWQVTRLPLAGMWQGRVAPAELVSVSVSCSEGRWFARALRPFSGIFDWVTLTSFQVSSTGFIGTEGRFGGGSVTGVMDPGGLLITEWGVTLQRLPDGTL